MLDLLRKLTILVLVCAPLVTAALGPGSTIAYASTPTPPPNTTSYYVSRGMNGVPSHDNALLNTLGCNAAKTGEAGLVILDFAGQDTESGVNGTYTWSQVFLSDTDVESAAEGFAQGFATCATSPQAIWLGVGTNSSGLVSQSLGQDWASVASAVNSWVQNASGVASYVVVAAANDIENGGGYWKSALTVEDWATGFTAANVGLNYFDYGNADCPTDPVPGKDENCSHGWQLHDIYSVAWGNAAALPVPEDYNIYGNNAEEWEQVVLFGNYNSGDSIPTFEGSMSELQACQQAGTPTSDPSCFQNTQQPDSVDTNSPGTAWLFLWDYLNCTDLPTPTLAPTPTPTATPPACLQTQQSPPWSTEVAWE